MDAPSRIIASPRRTERLLLLALILFFVGLSFQYARKASQGEGRRSAILRWYDQLVSFQDGGDIYEQSAYPNPPIMALILTPIVTWPEAVGLPLLAAGLTWFWLKVGMTLLCLRWAFRMVETPWQPFPLWAKVLTVSLSLRPIMGDLQHGNVNLFILFLVVGALYAFQQRRDFLSGLLVALAISCKVTPALLVPYLIWKRAWRAVAGCIVGVGLFFWPGLIPALFLGWDDNLQLVTSWANQMVRPFVVEGFVTSEHHNQSLPGLIYRLFTDSPSFITYINNISTPAAYHNLMSLPVETARWIIKLCMGLFAILVIWLCRTPRGVRTDDRPRLAAEYSLILFGMLLFSERTWKHHCVTLLLPLAVLSYQLAWEWSNRALRYRLIGCLAIATLLMSSASISIFGRETGKLAQVYGAFIAAFLVLMTGLIVLLQQSISRSVESDERTYARRVLQPVREGTRQPRPTEREPVSVAMLSTIGADSSPLPGSNRAHVDSQPIISP